MGPAIITAVYEGTSAEKTRFCCTAILCSLVRVWIWDGSEQDRKRMMVSLSNDVLHGCGAAFAYGWGNASELKASTAKPQCQMKAHWGER